MSLSEFGTALSNSSSDNSPRGHTRSPSSVEPESKEDVFLSQWSAIGSRQYIGVSDTQKSLKPGMYVNVATQRGMVFERLDVKVDDLLRFPDSISDKIIKEIEVFWNRFDIFKEYGFLHRRGYMFYGPPGSGKTALVQQIVSGIIQDGGIVFNCDNPETLNEALTTFRQIEPTRKVVCLFEDIDAIIDEYGDPELLSLLDGENQIDQVLNIATTNYPEKLDPRIVSRPRRFDRRIKIGMPGEDIRRMYFEKKLKITSAELDKWVKATDQFSFAACAELVISVKCLGNPFKDSVKIIKELIETKSSSSEYKEGPVGFSNL